MRLKLWDENLGKMIGYREMKSRLKELKSGRTADEPAKTNMAV